MLRKIIFTLLLGFFSLNTVLNAATLHDVDGKIVNTDSFKNKWVILNYWAAWCEGCVKEIPELNNFYKNNKDVVLYGYNFDQLPVPVLRKAIRRVRIEFPVLVEDPSVVWPIGDVNIIPATFIINPQGQIVKKVLGANTEASLSAALKEVQEKAN